MMEFITHPSAVIVFPVVACACFVLAFLRLAVLEKHSPLMLSIATFIVAAGPLAAMAAWTFTTWKPSWVTVILTASNLGALASSARSWVHGLPPTDARPPLPDPDGEQT